MSGSSSNGFGAFVPGLDFMQRLAQQAAGAAVPAGGEAPTAVPGLGAWVAPTFNVEDLDKRIGDLKAVHFWLDQNARALQATIQALEVQKMTLSTLQGMNINMGDVATALQHNASQALSSINASFAAMGTPAASGEEAGAVAEPTAQMPQASRAQDPSVASATDAKAEAPAPAPPAAAPGVDPLQWWGALSQQFQALAASATAGLGEGAALGAAPTSPAQRKAAAAGVGKPRRGAGMADKPVAVPSGAKVATPAAKAKPARPTAAKAGAVARGQKKTSLSKPATAARSAGARGR